MKAQTSIAGWIGLFLLATGGRVAAQDTIRARISFAYNQSRLSEAECRRLDSLVAVAADCPLRHLRITGNTDHYHNIKPISYLTNLPVLWVTKPDID